jgi:hypothetical protein
MGLTCLKHSFFRTVFPLKYTPRDFLKGCVCVHHLKTWESTGKSLSEALILVATNPQYVKRFLIELRVQYMKTSSEHVVNTNYYFFLY